VDVSGAPERLPDEDGEPMSARQLALIEARLRGEWTTPVHLDRREVVSLVSEIRWLQRRLRRVEFVLEPMVTGVRAALDQE
jgi:hypothetical protein